MRFLLPLVIALATSAVAAPLQYTWNGVSDGTVNGSAFTGKSFVITGQADSTNLSMPVSNVFYVPFDSLTIDIDGLGLFTFNPGGGVFVNNGAAAAGLIGPTQDLLNLESNTFQTWDLVTPVFVAGTLTNWPDAWQTLSTSGGTVALTTNSITGTFQGGEVSEIPEPGTVGLLLAGFTILGLRRARA